MSKVAEGLRPDWYYDSILTADDRKQIEKENKKYTKKCGKKS